MVASEASDRLADRTGPPDPVGLGLPPQNPPAGALRVLHLIGSLDRGGAETQVATLLPRLDSQRYAPAVCCLTHAGAMAEDLRSQGIRVWVLGLRRSGVLVADAVRAVGALRRMTRLLRLERPTILHAHMFHAYVLGAFAARASGVPIIVSGRHSTGPFHRGRSALLLERVANRFTDVIVACSAAVADDVQRHGHMPPERLRIIHNGVTLPSLLDPVAREAHRCAFGLSPEDPVLMCVANFHHYKGHRELIRAIRVVRGTVPSLKVLFVGDGPLRGSLEDLAFRNGLAATLQFLGPRDDVPMLLQLADGFVLPSHTEGLPLTVLEAMATGLPVVATRVGGIPEVVTDGKTGLLVPPGDLAALAAAIGRILQDPTGARRMGQAGRAQVEREFSLGRMVERTEQFYAELIREKLGLEYLAGRGWARTVGSSRAEPSPSDSVPGPGGESQSRTSS